MNDKYLLVRDEFYQLDYKRQRDILFEVLEEHYMSSDDEIWEDIRFTMEGWNIIETFPDVSKEELL
jgi:hypothetical protein